MPLPPDFPQSPHEILAPDARWVPDGGDMFWGRLPPLVEKLRVAVKAWRDGGYPDVSPTTAALLDWWFGTARVQDDLIHDSFRYYFAQREAIETIIYLYEVKRVQDKYDLLRFDSTGTLSAGQFDEDWLRFVVKMATGSGKTKVLSLALAWCYFHRHYEADSKLARNFLIIAPNIIVLDRLKKDFDGLRIFYDDPVLPENGHAGRNWRDDFQLTVHLQDEVRTAGPVGNIFLTNIHRVYAGDESLPSADDDDTSDYFLGEKAKKPDDSRVDLGEIVRDIDELAVFNDEAHHIHDPKMAWFKSIEDIHNRLKQKGGGLALQVDTTATPRHNNRAIFVQTVTDYPLVEAIAQNIVKHPVIPDNESRAKLKEKQSAKFSERYADYLHLGVAEWKKATAENDKLGKKSILFVMTDDTKNCDEVAEYLESICSELKDAVLVIHTKNNGEFYEANTAKKKAELEKLREQANNIDDDAQHKAIVSVLMLKEGWDVRNITTIVGLRPYSAKSNILPEQTLGRGLRLMFRGGEPEELSVIGIDAFMDFVEDIKGEGVVIEAKGMGDTGTGEPQPWVVVEVDQENPHKDIDALDIAFPALTPRNYRDFERLEALDTTAFQHEKMPYQQFGKESMRKIKFVYMVTEEESHEMTMPPSGVSDYRQVVKFYTDSIVRALRLVSAHHVLYGKVKSFIRDELFGHPVDLEDRNTLRNLSEFAVTKQVVEVFKKEINALLTVRKQSGATIDRWVKVSDMRPFRAVRGKNMLPNPQKSVFNFIVGDSRLEIEFAQFLERCGDIISYAKNYYAVGFRMDYVKAGGDLSNYTPDFLVKKSSAEVYVVETKGRVDENVPHQMARLKQWCDDVNRAQSDVRFDFVYVDEESFAAYKPKDFAGLVDAFREYK